MKGAARGPALGVLVPCRDEALVIERKLANLARARWPVAARPHRIVVIDDGSRDGTAERARLAFLAEAALLSAASVRCELVLNHGRPGKPGAIQAGLAALAGETELVVLSDADVVLEPGALDALSAAFGREPRLALACGAQRFVRSLAADGSMRAEDGGALVDASELFDRASALVRRLESRRGRLFSVHGQLLAWRAELALAPSPGLAADDLDLMLQVRMRMSEPRRTELVPEAVFVEQKTPRGERAREQALRRARAWFGVLAAWDGRAKRDLQWLFYRHAPTAAPELAASAAALAALAAGLAAGAGAALATVAAELLFASTPAGRHALALLACIARARSARHAPPAERWEMARR